MNSAPDAQFFDLAMICVHAPLPPLLHFSPPLSLSRCPLEEEGANARLLQFRPWLYLNLLKRDSCCLLCKMVVRELT